jgi:cell division septation protein DedD
MPTTECATDIALPNSQSEESQDAYVERASQETASQETASQETSRPLRGLLFGFAATVTVGLALASWYVGVRIVSADEVGPSNATTSRPVSAAPATPQAAKPATASEASIAEAFWYTVPPTILYLQVAGLGPKQDAGFVRSLQAKGFRAQVQARDDDPRILIGPFSTHAKMEQAQRKLQSAGVLAIETEH